MYEGSCAADAPRNSGLELTRTRPVFSVALPAASFKGKLATESWVLPLVLPYVGYKAGTSNYGCTVPCRKQPCLLVAVTLSGVFSRESP